MTTRFELFTRLSESCPSDNLKQDLLKYRKGKLPSKVCMYNGRLRYTGNKAIDEVIMTSDNMDQIARFFALYINTSIEAHDQPQETKRKPVSSINKYHNFPKNLRIYLLRETDKTRKAYLSALFTYKFYTDAKFKSGIVYQENGAIESFPDFELQEPSSIRRILTTGDLF